MILKPIVTQQRDSRWEVRRNYLFIGHPSAGWRSAVIYSVVGSCPCRMRHGPDHAERLTMPNKAFRETISPGFANVQFGIV